MQPNTSIPRSSQWTAPRQRIPRAQLTDILQYTPHIPSICCAAASPSLRYARETVAGTRADHSVHHRGDLYVCWDWTTNREYHSFSGGEDELAADLRNMAWWLTRPFTGNGEPMILEVNVKKQSTVRRTPHTNTTSSSIGRNGEVSEQSELESILRILTSPPYQRTDADISCLRSLILTPNQLRVGPGALDLIGRLTHLEKLECFSQYLSLPLPSLSSLYVLMLRNTKSLTTIDSLVPLRRLRKLSLCRCSELNSLAALASLPELTEVRLANCRQLDLGGDFSSCRRLSSFSMRWCKEVRNVGALATLPNLRELDCSYCGLHQVEDLVRCAQLRRLSLRGCQRMHELFPIPEEMEDSSSPISRSYNVATVAGQAGINGVFSSLSSTSSGSTPTNSITRQQSSSLLWSASCASPPVLPLLEELDAGESDLASLSGVARCAPELRQLTVRECKHLHSLSPLGRLPTLTSVDASFSGVNELEGLSESFSLQYVNLKHCTQLRSVAPLARVSSLREVDVSLLNQNCIICIDDLVDAEGAEGESLAQRRRRSELAVLNVPAYGVGMDDTQIDTAVVQRSAHGLSQHHVFRDDAETLLSQPLSSLRISERGTTSAIW